MVGDVTIVCEAVDDPDVADLLDSDGNVVMALKEASSIDTTLLPDGCYTIRVRG